MAEKKITLSGDQLYQMAEQERRRLDEINRKAETFQKFRNELQGAKDALEELISAKKGDELLVNLGSGVYVKAALSDATNAVSSITGNVFKGKSFKDVTKILGQKMENIDKTLKKTAEEQQQTLTKLNRLDQIMVAGKAHLQKQREQQ